MQDTLTSRNHQDFKQRYQDTYGWLLKNDTKLFVYIKHVSADRATFVDVKNNEYYVFKDAGINFEFIPVKRGWFNAINDTYYLARHPARQFQRGISTQNTTINVLKKDLIPIEMSIGILNKIFNQEVPYVTAFNNLMQRKTNKCALSKHFAVDITSSNIWFDNYKVGDVLLDDKHCRIRLKTDLVLQEITDCINRNGYTASVEVMN